MTESLQATINAATETPDGWDTPEVRAAVRETIDLLDRGEVRIAEPPAETGGEWTVNAWAKQAILFWFRIAEMTSYEVGPYEYHDKIPLKTGYAASGVRVVPPAVLLVLWVLAVPPAAEEPAVGRRPAARVILSRLANRKRGKQGESVHLTR